MANGPGYALINRRFYEGLNVSKARQAGRAFRLIGSLPPSSSVHRYVLLEKVEDRRRYLSSEGPIIRRDSGLKKKRLHLYQLAEKWVPMSYEETVRFCFGCKSCEVKVKF